MSFIMLSLICIFCAGHMQAQLVQVLDASGGSGQSASLSLLWSVGEIAIASQNSGNTLITQGFLQPVMVATAIDEKDGLPYTITAYPNPAREWVEVRLYEADWRDFVYQLRDISGRLLVQVKPEDATTRIPLDSYAAGLYLLKAMQSGKESVVFEIVKP